MNDSYFYYPRLVLNTRGKFLVDDRIYFKGATCQVQRSMFGKLSTNKITKALCNLLQFLGKKATSCQVAARESQLFPFYQELPHTHTHTKEYLLYMKWKQANNSFSQSLPIQTQNICSPCLKCIEDTVEVDKGLKPLQIHISINGGLFTVPILWQHAKSLSVNSKKMTPFYGYVRILLYGILLKVSGLSGESKKSSNLFHWNGI